MPDGGGAGQSGGEAGADPANLEYTREATDLVLDYLKNQRETPDPELLDRLDWTPDDLQRFLDRWEQARELARSNDADQQRQFEEELRALGLRPPRAGAPAYNAQDDAQRGLRDAGNRIAPPARYQDAFESFRRAVSGGR